MSSIPLSSSANGDALANWCDVHHNDDGTHRYFGSDNAPISAVTVGSVVAGNGPYWLCGAGNTLYSTVSNDSRIIAYNIGNPGGAPVELGRVTVGTSTGWIEKKGKYLFATDQNAGVLRVIDMSNPVTPVVSQTLSLNADGNGIQGRFGLQVRGNLMCIGGAAAGGTVGTIYIVENSLPTACSIVGTLQLAGAVNLRGGISFGASYFAISSRDDATVRIIDADVPTAPVEIAKIQTTVSNTTTPVQQQGTYLYVGQYGNGITGALEVWDIATPWAPVQAGTITIPGGCEQMVIRGSNLYIGHRPSTTVPGNIFTVVEVRNPALPKLMATYQLGGDQTPGIAASNGYVYRTSSESPGSSQGKVYAVRVVDDVQRRLSAIEDILQLRPPNIT